MTPWREDIASCPASLPWAKLSLSSWESHPVAASFPNTPLFAHTSIFAVSVRHRSHRIFCCFNRSETAGDYFHTDSDLERLRTHSSGCEWGFFCTFRNSPSHTSGSCLWGLVREPFLFVHKPAVFQFVTMSTLHLFFLKGLKRTNSPPPSVLQPRCLRGVSPQHQTRFFSF